MGFRARHRTASVEPTLMRDVVRRIRQHLDSESILKTAERIVGDYLPQARASVWLTTGYELPKKAFESRDNDGGVRKPPDIVIRCSRQLKTVNEKSSGGMAVPIIAPQSGLLGVLLIEADAPLEDDANLFIHEVVAEIGVALQSANLYEQAVTAKEKSEAILARVGDAVVVTGPTGVITGWNPAAEQAIGSGRREAIGHRCEETLGLRHGERELDCSQGCALLAMKSESTLGIEVWRKREDGRRQPFLANVSAVQDRGGRLTEIVHSLRDVTRLMEADEAKNLFLATASHELKTPLTVIQGFAQTLLRAPDWDMDQRNRALSAMARRALELNKIVDRLMLSSRIEGGRVDVSMKNVDVAPIIQERVQALGGSTGRLLVVDLPDDLVTVRSDPDAFATVLDHLLDNAVKYSPGGETVTVTATVTENSVRVHVADAGIGMNEEQAEKCFEKFWQAESSDDRRFGGTGIGLYIVRSLVEAMGGQISVESSMGDGSTFSVMLIRSDVALPKPPPTSNGVDVEGLKTAEPSVIREFMRQIGIPTGGKT